MFCKNVNLLSSLRIPLLPCPLEVIKSSENSPFLDVTLNAPSMVESRSLSIVMLGVLFTKVLLCFFERVI